MLNNQHLDCCALTLSVVSARRWWSTFRFPCLLAILVTCGGVNLDAEASPVTIAVGRRSATPMMPLRDPQAQLLQLGSERADSDVGDDSGPASMAPLRRQAILILVRSNGRVLESSTTIRKTRRRVNTDRGPPEAVACSFVCRRSPLFRRPPRCRSNPLHSLLASHAGPPPPKCDQLRVAYENKIFVAPIVILCADATARSTVTRTPSPPTTLARIRRGLATAIRAAVTRTPATLPVPMCSSDDSTQMRSQSEDQT
jgi:hypothetical protein